MGVRRLKELARQCGIQPIYYDVDQHRRTATPETLIAVLNALGVPIESVDQAPDLLRARQQDTWQQKLEPVFVCWYDKPTQVRIRLPETRATGAYHGQLVLEDGTIHRLEGRLENLPKAEHEKVEGQNFVALTLRLPEALPAGYHTLTLELPTGVADCMIIRAPRKTYPVFRGRRQRAWGVFLPLYALHSERSWGAGDLTDLQGLFEWAGRRGASAVGCLPLTACFWDLSDDFSPYSPASRLFWNEYYLDLARAPELDRTPEARRHLDSDQAKKRLADLRNQETVDYPGIVELKRKILTSLSESFFQSPDPQRRKAYEAFLAACPDVDDYARFRAVGERHGIPWDHWPANAREGEIRDGDFDPSVCQRHLYAQWLAYEQYHETVRRAESDNLLWYMDFPLGVNRFGYDTWVERSAFALGAGGGAPPDTFFAKGQNWAFPPLHPNGLRQQRYRYFIRTIRRQLEFAHLLRIDHVASLHRLYWIPEGLEATQGAYVSYPAEEFYAILTLESQRAKSDLIGEDLGTVPTFITKSMRRHGMEGMYVLPFETDGERKPAVRTPPRLSVAGLNTHDVPPLASFLTGKDIDLRVEIGLTDRQQAAQEHEQRRQQRETITTFLCDKGLLAAADRDDLQAILEACLRFLAYSPAHMVLVNLEDLWLETRQQNLPGTFREHPNWRHKAARRLEAIREDRDVQALLDTVAKARKRVGQPPGQS